MQKNISTSSFKNLPAALLICLALILLTEWFLFANRADFINNFWNKFLVNEHVLTEMEKDFDYLIVGDSLQKTGIDTALASDNVLNIGLPGSKPMSQYMLLKRYLKTHKPPKAIFLFIDPEYPEDSLLVILRYYASIEDFIEVYHDLNWKERRYFLMRYWASLDMRGVGGMMEDSYPGSNAQFVDTLKENLGFMHAPRADKAIAEDEFARSIDRDQSRISISDIDTKYFDKLLKLSKDKGIKVVLMGQLFPKELYNRFERNGFNDEYRAYLAVLKSRYPELYFDKDPILYINNKYFGDVSHLNSKGSAIYTTYFKERLLKPYSEMFDKKR
jgi:hypothetical protein